MENEEHSASKAEDILRALGEKRTASKAEELLIALGADPDKLATTGHNLPASQNTSTKNTGDIIPLVDAKTTDDWLNSTPYSPVPAAHHTQDSDALDVSTVVYPPAKKQTINTPDEYADFSDNPFETSPEALENSAQAPAANIPGGATNLPSDPTIHIAHIQPQGIPPQTTPPYTSGSGSANTIYQQETFAHTSAPATTPIPPTHQAQHPPMQLGGGNSQHNSKRGKAIALLICLVLLGGMVTSWAMNMPQALSQSPLSQTPNESTSIIPTTMATTPPDTQSTPTVHTTSTTKPKPTQTPEPPPAQTKAPEPTPTPAPPVVAYKYSFEGGGTDSWASGHNISSVQNSTDIAKVGNHSLKVTFNSTSDTDYPYVAASKLPSTLRSGQTVTAYVYVASGSNVRAKIYIQDQNLTWFDPGRTALDTLPVGQWHQLRFTLPATATGSARIVGIQFYGYNTIAYIDVVTW